jgi:hypothetical protein
LHDRLGTVSAIAGALLALLAARNASATAIMLFVGKDGVVLTADSKQLVLGKESSASIQKILRIDPHHFLASAGPTHVEDDSVTLDGKPWAYEYRAFATGIAHRMKGSNTASIADAVWQDAQRIFAPVGAQLAALHQKILFVVVGIDDGVPHAWEIKVFPRQNDTQIGKEEVLPSAAGEMWTGNGFAPGDLESPSNLINEAHQRAPQLFTPAADFDDRAVFSGLLVSLRAEHSPQNVGPPIKQLIVLRGGRIIERTWTETLLRPHKRVLGEAAPTPR